MIVVHSIRNKFMLTWVLNEIVYSMGGEILVGQTLVQKM